MAYATGGCVFERVASAMCFSAGDLRLRMGYATAVGRLAVAGIVFVVVFVLASGGSVVESAIVVVGFVVVSVVLACGCHVLVERVCWYCCFWCPAVVASDFWRCLLTAVAVSAGHVEKNPFLIASTHVDLVGL